MPPKKISELTPVASVEDTDEFVLARAGTTRKIAAIDLDVGGGGGGAPSGPAGGVLSGTYPDPGFAADMATQAELDAHINDSLDAHDGTAISYAGGTGMSATDVEGAIDELATEKQNAASVAADSGVTAHLADAIAAHAGSAISYAGGTGMSATDVEAAIDELATEKQNAASVAADSGVTAHLADTSDAHDASAISILDTASDFTATDVEGALAELQTQHEAIMAVADAFTVSNFATLRTLDANAYTSDNLADFICTFVNDLKALS